MIINPNWVSGFVDGEGTFYVGFNKQPEMVLGIQVLPEFRVVQHQRDIKLLHALKDFFKAGVVRRNHEDRYELRIRNLQHLQEIIIPFFDQYPLLTQKKFDFIKFKKIISILTAGKIDKEKILEMIEISSLMNRKNKVKTLQLKKEIMDKDMTLRP